MSVGSMLRKVGRRIFPAPVDPDPFPVDAWTDPAYPAWFDAHKATCDDLALQRACRDYRDISFSILVPLYKTPLPYLSDLVESVLMQTHERFELILINGSADDMLLKEALKAYKEIDSRIRVITLEENRGIAGNTAAGLAVASGEYVALLDHDDIIEPNALFEYARAIREVPDAAFYYCDEDLFEATQDEAHHKALGAEHSNRFVCKHPLFKPDFSRSLLACKNYLLHMLCFKRVRLEEQGIPDSSFDGAQDYKLIIDALETSACPHHIPKVLYHWRMCETSTATNPDSKPHGKLAYLKCLQEIAQKDWESARIIGTGIENLFNPWATGRDAGAKVSVIIDVVYSDDAAGFLQRFEATNSYANCELIFIGHPPDMLPSSQLQMHWVEPVPNSGLYGRLGQGASVATGSYLLFVDTGCFFTSAQPLEQLVHAADCDWIGIASPKTLYADHSIKGYGTAVTAERIMPLYRGYPEDFPGYQCNMRAFQESSACGWQGAFISKDLFEQVGGFDEQFASEVGMADLCYRVSRRGLCTTQVCTVQVMTADACPQGRYDCMRNAPDYPEQEIALFDAKWPGVRAAGDPYFNRNLDQSSSYFQIAPSSKGVS